MYTMLLDRILYVAIMCVGVYRNCFPRMKMWMRVVLDGEPFGKVRGRHAHPNLCVSFSDRHDEREWKGRRRRRQKTDLDRERGQRPALFILWSRTLIHTHTERESDTERATLRESELVRVCSYLDCASASSQLKSNQTAEWSGVESRHC